MNFKKGPIVDFGLPSSPNSKVQTSKQNKKKRYPNKTKKCLSSEFTSLLSVEC